MSTIKNKRFFRQNTIPVAIVVISCLIQVFNFDKSCLGQSDQIKLLKIGINGVGGIIFSSQLNTLKTSWTDMVVEESNFEAEGNTLSIPLRFEYGFQPYLSIHPIKLLQVGIKMDFTYSSSKSKFENSIINETFELKFKRKTYIPGVYALLTLNKFEIGAALIQSYNEMQVTDDFFGYNDTWYGKNLGYEVSVGFTTSHQNLMGFNMSIKYRGLKINELEDSLNRKVTYNDTQENLSLNLSGIIINVGLYFQFMELKKRKNEESNTSTD